MFALYSKGCEYAIRALAEISAEKSGRRFLARDICKKAGIPEAYARKTFQALVQNGFLSAVSGPGGGYSLTQDPGKVTVLDVVEAVEGQENFTRCVLGLAACDADNPCSLHSVWMDLKKSMMSALASRTLAELSESIQKKKKKSGRKK